MGAAILQDLVAVMVIAAAVTIVFYRLKQPVVLGYLLAGLLVGPHVLGLIHDTDSIDGLAHLGLIFLMFSVGLEFDLKKLRKVGARAAIAATTQVGLLIWLGYQAGRMLGWSPMDSIFLGAMISMSSTTIIVKILAEQGKLKEEYSELAFGILIIEDIFAIVMVAVFTTMGSTGAFSPGVMGSTLGAVFLFTFIFLAICLVTVPRLIESVSKYHVEEVLVITVVGLAFAAALLAENLGFSIALGAFLMGAIIAESRAVKRVEHKILPIRDLFSSLFFVAVGMIISPSDMIAYWPAILAVTLVTILGKVVGVMAAAFLVGYDGRTAVKTGTAMGQIGEFSFIIAGLGVALGIASPELYPISIAVCAITSVSTPFLMRAGPAAADRLAPRLPTWYVSAISGYTSFVRRRFGGRGLRAAHDRRRSRHGTRMAIYAAWLFGLFILAAYASEWVGAEVGTRLSLSDNATRAAAIAILGLAALPLFVAFVKATEAYMFATAKANQMNPKHLAGRRTRWHEPRLVSRLVGGAASIVLVTVASLVAWGVHPLAVPNLWYLVPILMAVVAVGVFAWPKLERVYVGMEKTLNELMGVEDHSLEDDRNKRLRERLPWGMDMEEVQVRPIDRAAWMSLKDLDLRERTGANVLLVERGHQVFHNPHADIPLLPHDRIVLVGKRDQLDRATHYLATLAHHAAAVVEREVRIPGGSPAIGHTVEEMGVRGSVGLIQRRDGALVAPSPRALFEPDDHVTVYGPEANMERVRERLKARPSTRGKIGPAG